MSLTVLAALAVEAAEPLPVTHWGSFLQFVIASATGAFGANLLSAYLKARERSSQVREAARDEDLAVLIRMADELDKLATEYWTSSESALGPREVQLKAVLLSRQHHSNYLVAQLFTDDMKRECDVQFVKVMDAVSGGDFGEPGRAADPNRLVAIYIETLAFVHLAKKCRRRLGESFLAKIGAI